MNYFSSLESTETTPDSHFEETDSSPLDWEDTDAFDDNHRHSTEQHDMKLNAAKFVLKTKEECKLTQTSVDAILASVKGL